MKKNQKKEISNNAKIGLLNFTGKKLFFDKYDFERYIKDVKIHGLEVTWANILNYVKNNGCNDFLNPHNFGELYEAGLAERDKNKKKKSGQYYTPKDVSLLMSKWLLNLKGENICDVGCGTGNLILSYLELLSKDEVLYLLREKRIYLYDFDKIALTIAQYSIALIYGLEYLENININYGDFLDEKITLPKNSKIITNPPYGLYERLSPNWSNSKIQKDTREFYAAFMEKILISKNPAVFITPYSFLGGRKFNSLRNLLSEYNGFIISFDNVPGNIFRGRKHGVFNTNTSNSVRAAITVVENKDDIRGFRTSPLIRFKNQEREKLLQTNLLEEQLSEKRQTTVDEEMFIRCPKELEECLEVWIRKSNESLGGFRMKKEGYTLYMPNTCRYYTTASKRKLSRKGYHEINLDDKDKFNFLYGLINSSFVYWWWRIYDGGITYPVKLLNSVPIFYDLLTFKDKEDISNIVEEMILKEEKYIVTKRNAGNIQENIKFPKKYRDLLNRKFIEILECTLEGRKFDILHKNSFFGD